MLASCTIRHQIKVRLSDHVSQLYYQITLANCTIRHQIQLWLSDHASFYYTSINRSGYSVVATASNTPICVGVACPDTIPTWPGAWPTSRRAPPTPSSSHGPSRGPTTTSLLSAVPSSRLTLVLKILDSEHLCNTLSSFSALHYA